MSQLRGKSTFFFAFLSAWLPVSAVVQTTQAVLRLSRLCPASKLDRYVLGGMQRGHPRCMRELRALCSKERGRKLGLCRRTGITESLRLEENLSGHLAQPFALSQVNVKYSQGCLGHWLSLKNLEGGRVYNFFVQSV